MRINITNYTTTNSPFTYITTDDIAKVLREYADGYTELQNDASSGQYIESIYGAVRALDRLNEVGKSTTQALLKG